MNLVLSSPTSRGGGCLLVPVWGTAHLVVGNVVYQVQLFGASISSLTELRIQGVSLVDAEVWFEDVREVSH